VVGPLAAEVVGLADLQSLPCGTAVRSGYCRYALTADSDMGMTEITWELDGGQISAEESVRKLVEVIRSKKLDHTGTFWTWENEEYPW
ncbi:hypothetical protein KXX38_003467, partial [Aspergillus fumigatus]